MTLAVDIGNSNIVIALYKADHWTKTFRYETKETQPEYFYEGALRNLLLEWGISSSKINNSVISSVVPDLNESIRYAIFSVMGHQPLIINPEVIMALDIHMPHPYEIGSDIVCNAYAALKLYGSKVIVIDFGTALTFTAADHDKGLFGVSIAPGLQTAAISLASHTAQLPMVPMELPKSALGYDTMSAIQSGVMWGYVGLVKEMIGRIKSEIGSDYKVIATGGLSTILHPLEDNLDQVDKMLTLEGMRLIQIYYQTHLL
ncbi:MAG: type III pantothenate kinase [Saprospiraceae bacterium]